MRKVLIVWLITLLAITASAQDDKQASIAVVNQLFD